MRPYRLTLVAIVLLLNALSARAEEAATAADNSYREAVLQETTSRDLGKAIELYQKTLQLPDATRNLQSNAYLRMGICYEITGSTTQAKVAWTKVVQDYPDQRSAFLEAKTRLQTLTAETATPIVQVQASTPTVVYAPPPTRWIFEWLDYGFYHTLDSKGRFLDDYSQTAFNVPHSLEYHVNSYLAVGLEGRKLFSSDEFFENPASVYPYYFGTRILSRSLAYIAPTARLEKRLGWGLTPYAKFGPAAYRFHFSGDFGDSTKWSPGIMSEAGITLGWPRGFTLSLGYSILGFDQRVPDINTDGLVQPTWGTAGSISQDHGWRWVGGPTFKLGFRW